MLEAACTMATPRLAATARIAVASSTACSWLKACARRVRRSKNSHSPTATTRSPKPSENPKEPGMRVPMYMLPAKSPKTPTQAVAMPQSWSQEHHGASLGFSGAAGGDGVCAGAL